MSMSSYWGLSLPVGCPDPHSLQEREKKAQEAQKHDLWQQEKKRHTFFLEWVAPDWLCGCIFVVLWCSVGLMAVLRICGH